MYLQEHFCVLYLNNNGAVLGFRHISTGTVKSTIVDVRLVYAIALKMMASKIVLAHNHPSGSMQPSLADQTLTDKIIKAGKLLDIEVFDHIILCNDAWVSMKQLKMI